jgi:hypothetical protein
LSAPARLPLSHTVTDADGEVVQADSTAMSLLSSADVARRGIDRSRFMITTLVPSTMPLVSSSGTAGSDV